jgi:hypothetical protein
MLLLILPSPLSKVIFVPLAMLLLKRITLVIRYRDRHYDLMSLINDSRLQSIPVKLARTVQCTQ